MTNGDIMKLVSTIQDYINTLTIEQLESLKSDIEAKLSIANKSTQKAYLLSDAELDYFQQLFGL